MTNPQEQEMPNYETAFVILRTEDGNWRAVTDLAQPFSVSRQAQIGDIGQGVRELAEVIHQQSIAQFVLSALSQNSQEDSQRVSASVRDALSKRKTE